MASESNKKKGVLHVFGIEKRDDRNEPGKTFNIWTRIGTAFVNDDESINLKLSYVPLGPDITIQVRKPDERGKGAEEQRGGDRPRRSWPSGGAGALAPAAMPRAATRVRRARVDPTNTPERDHP